MVLVKMLMEIDPLPMRGLMVMTMVTIPPPGGMFPRQNSSAGALDWFRQVPPRDGGASSRKLAYDFFQGRRHLIPEDGHRGAARWPSRQGRAQGGRAHPPPSWTVGGPPLVHSSPDIFNIFQNWLSWSFMTFGAVQNRFPIFAPFLAKNPSCRHSPSSC